MSDAANDVVDVPVPANAYVIKQEYSCDGAASECTRIYYLPQVTGRLEATLKINAAEKLLLYVKTVGSQVQKHTCEPEDCEVHLKLDPFDVEEVKYHFLEIACEKLDGNTLLERITGVSFSGPAAKGLKCNIGNDESALRTVPSVHLGYDVPEEDEVHWFYNEIVVPEGFDHVGSYYMVSGAEGLYSGLQVNSETERRVLFAVWSNYETDNPDEIPDEYKVQLLRKDKDVVAQDFGDEGSGGQSFLRYNWKTGSKYSCLVCAQPEQDSTIYTMYFGAPESWSYRMIASWRKPKTGGALLLDLHSFVEHFDYEELGHLPFKAYYSNQWMKTGKGEWKELTEGRMSTTASPSTHQRLDIDCGVDNKKFFLLTGGFGCVQSADLLEKVFRRPATGQLPNINFGLFHPAFLET